MFYVFPRNISAMGDVSRSVGPEEMLPLHQAVAAGDLSLVRRLLASGEDINGKDEGLFNATPLMMAAGVGHVEAAELLLQEGANQGLVNYSGSTAVMFAAFLGNPQVCGYNGLEWLFHEDTIAG